MAAAVPTVAINIDFRHPSRLGDVLEFRLYVKRVGRSSIDLRIMAIPADDPDGTDRFTMTSTLVFTRKDIAGSVPWPVDLRAALQHQINKQDQHDT
jgi:4-hydroxybenzoyl-CoA thioesterase